MRYRFSKLNCALILVVIPSMVTELHWKINKLYFFNDQLVHEIAVLYGNMISCIIKIRSLEPHRTTNSISVQCTTDHNTVTVLTFAGIALTSYIAYDRSNILLRPFLLFIIKLSMCAISALTLSENASKQMFTILLIEFRLVSLFYGTAFLLVHTLLYGISFIIGFAHKEEELFLG